jgi:phosphohistidine phosphatase
VIDADGARLLVVVRHARAEDHGPTDFERTLTPDGRRDATEAGRWLAGEGFTPDHALVSAAVRARETWEALADGAGWRLEPELDPGMYAAEPDTVLDLVGLVDDAVERLVVIGHNPTIGYLAHLLGDGTAEPLVAARLMSGFPTCAVAVFRWDGSWGDLAVGGARLVATHVGRA